MPYSEDQLLPISALQHLLFCERQCALIHIEQVWSENVFTAEGTVLHERAHEGPDESRPGVRITRGLPVRSFQLGISGQCDVVEFHGGERSARVLPVEYKRGKPKIHRADEVQLCAQGLCLEEMLGCPVERGALYYGEQRHRTEICFDETLRILTRDTAARLHTLIAHGSTPPARKEKKCESCSLLEACMPGIFGFQRGAAAWFSGQLKTIEHNSA
ncbi:MAG: CRISPR-associated protein Cas4 [Chthoniobacteraceae bacterium]